MITVRFCLRVLGLMLLLASAGLATAADKVFDHARTGFDLTGGHAFVPCESCHISGQFIGTPRECVACHSINGRFNATPKPVNHIHTSERCDACHNTTAWQAVPVVDHHEVFGRCQTCHNNVIIAGQPPGHIPVQNDCVDCHSDLSWQPAHFNHEKVDVTSCSNCHNGFGATGKPPTHMPILADQCGACHYTSFWVEEREVDHTLVSNQCATCHLGQFADRTMPATHIPVVPVCQDCHNTIAFGPVDRVDHDHVMGTCLDCHANSKPANHINIVSGAQCSECHTTTTWQSPMIDHDFVIGTCSSCHNNRTAIGQGPNHIPTEDLECDVCHKSFISFPAGISF